MKDLQFQTQEEKFVREVLSAHKNKQTKDILDYHIYSDNTGTYITKGQNFVSIKRREYYIECNTTEDKYLEKLVQVIMKEGANID